MQDLTSRTMAEFSIKRFLSAELVLHASAMAAAFVERFEIWVIVVDFVGDSEFPFVVLAFYFFVFAALGFGLVLLGLCGCHFGECREDEGSDAGSIDQWS
jgi:hypothetical protein